MCFASSYTKTRPLINDVLSSEIKTAYGKVAYLRRGIFQLAFGNILSFQSFLEMYTAQLTFFPYLTLVRRLRSIDKGNHVIKINYCEKIQVFYRERDPRPAERWHEYLSKVKDLLNSLHFIIHLENILQYVSY